TETRETGIARGRRSAGSGLDQQVATDGLQSCRIDEIGQLYGAHLCRSALPCDLHAHDAVGTNRDALCAGGNRDGGLNLVAARIDELPLGVGLEIAVAGVRECPVRLQHLEESAALNREIE